MGRAREELGFQCPGRCGGLIHGSVEIIIQEYHKREIARSDNDVDPRSIRLWPNMKPVEYAWKNEIETRVEIGSLITETSDSKRQAWNRCQNRNNKKLASKYLINFKS